ncbi:MAG: saccharopine dehydrogenase-like oxidoreductase [Armatimonadota bacterium]
MNERTIRLAILGAGGLGQSMVRLIEHKPNISLTAICDSTGVAIDPDGLAGQDVVAAAEAGSVAQTANAGRMSDDPLGDVIAAGDCIDGVFVALPNLPNSFIPEVTRCFAQGGYRGVMVDALKRTTAVEMMLDIDGELREAGITYVTGAGATPGLLTAAAALAAQSFVEIEKVEVYFGVGISNWDTIREDIAHLPGFDVQRAGAMSEEEIEAELDRRNGILELVDMEHADDVILEALGVCDRDRVTVGGVVDTRRARKPVSTNVKVYGRTFDGKRSHHTFTLGDETSMAANVCGPALGFLNAGLWLHDRGHFGVFTSGEIMPRMTAPLRPSSDGVDASVQRAARAGAASDD